MKKYNSFLGAFFSGDSGQGGYNAAYGKSALAKLYTSQDPAEQQMAAEGLARVDPESAAKWQQEQAKISQQNLERKARMLASAPTLEAKQQLYASIQPEVSKMWAQAPKVYTPELDQMLTAWAGADGGKPKARSSHILADGTIAFMDEYGNLTKTGEKASNTYGFQTDAEGNVYAQDRRQGNLKPAGMGGANTQEQPPKDYRQTAIELQGMLRDAGIDPEAAREIATMYHDKKASAPKGQYTDGVIADVPAGTVLPQPVSGGQARVAVKPKEEKIETWGAPTAVTKNGKPAMIQISNLGNERERPDLAPADSTKAPSVDASNAAGFYKRMAQSEQIISQLEQQGYSPASNKGDYFTAGGTMTNWATSPKGQQYYNAATNWIRANLRKESGAAIGVDEAKQEFSTYFPIPGDTKETIEQKRQLRQQTAESVKGAGLPAMKYQDQSGGKSQANGFDPLGILK